MNNVEKKYRPKSQGPHSRKGWTRQVPRQEDWLYIVNEWQGTPMTANAEVVVSNVQDPMKAGNPSAEDEMETLSF